MQLSKLLKFHFSWKSTFRFLSLYFLGLSSSSLYPFHQHTNTLLFLPFKKCLDPLISSTIASFLCLLLYQNLVKQQCIAYVSSSHLLPSTHSSKDLVLTAPPEPLLWTSPRLSISPNILLHYSMTSVKLQMIPTFPSESNFSPRL